MTEGVNADEAVAVVAGVHCLVRSFHDCMAMFLKDGKFDFLERWMDVIDRLTKGDKDHAGLESRFTKQMEFSILEVETEASVIQSCDLPSLFHSIAGILGRAFYLVREQAVPFATVDSDLRPLHKAPFRHRPATANLRKYKSPQPVSPSDFQQHHPPPNPMVTRDGLSMRSIIQKPQSRLKSTQNPAQLSVVRDAADPRRVQRPSPKPELLPPSTVWMNALKIPKKRKQPAKHWEEAEKGFNNKRPHDPVGISAPLNPISTPIPVPHDDVPFAEHVASLKNRTRYGGDYLQQDSFAPPACLNPPSIPSVPNMFIKQTARQEEISWMTTALTV
eukprot:TRINITY_DN15387_c0_g1_i1.p1 TRINITY_DN15387_c0_g1~~TRINITY_DN15387_c0_g1_i1.p1  ORF type:complete len:332 (+),score=48.25 TRINITY_DN15387_c0_g1_i1:1079-2074(+)